MGKILLLIILILVIVAMIYARRIKKRAARKARVAAISARADAENELVLAGDPRGFFGDYPIPDLGKEPGHMSVAEAEHLLHPDSSPDPATSPQEWEDWSQAKLDQLRRHEAATAMAAKIKESGVLAGLTTHAFTVPVTPGEYDAVKFDNGQIVEFPSVRMGAPGDIVVNMSGNVNEVAHLKNPVLRRRGGDFVEPGATVVTNWGGEVVRVMQDKYSGTLTVAEAQMMMEKAKQQFNWDQAASVAARYRAASARKVDLEPPRPRKPTPSRKATPSRKPAKRAAAAKKPPIGEAESA
jgi:hypothetical protein